jgi:dehydrogenase/reductase SDR family protein 1
MFDLSGKIAVVTGASRGVGRGVALGLGEAGATVYVTGREKREYPLPEFLNQSTLVDTAAAINQLGGEGIVHYCDHRDDEAVKTLFERITKEQGRLDILVNNAWGGGIHAMSDYFFNTPFWEQPVALWDDHYQVGVRSNYVAGKYAAAQMVKQKSGLIVNISFYGGQRYFNNVAYGVCKATVDRMSKDMAHELKPYGVTVISLYPGNVSTEGMVELAKYNEAVELLKMESPQFVGRCIAALAQDEQKLCETGKILITAELANQYNLTDVNGSHPESLRNLLWEVG